MSDAPRCGECGMPMVLRRPPGKRPRWQCSLAPACRATHGAHPDGTPMGRPGSEEERQARTIAHSWFDRLWKHGPMTRPEAYDWLGRELPGAPGHISSMSVEECQRVIARVKLELIARLKRKFR